MLEGDRSHLLHFPQEVSNTARGDNPGIAGGKEVTWSEASTRTVWENPLLRIPGANSPERSWEIQQCGGCRASNEQDGVCGGHCQDSPGQRSEPQSAKGRGSGGRPPPAGVSPSPLPGAQSPQLTKGCLSRSSAVGLRFSSTKICLRKLRQEFETPSGSWGLVGWVAILKIAAMASNSAHGGFSVNISTTVQATLLQQRQAHRGETAGKGLEWQLCI